jgi:hypothetical protein
MEIVHQDKSFEPADDGVGLDCGKLDRHLSARGDGTVRAGEA